MTLPKLPSGLHDLLLTESVDRLLANDTASQHQVQPLADDAADVMADSLGGSPRPAQRRWASVQDSKRIARRVRLRASHHPIRTISRHGSGSREGCWSATTRLRGRTRFERGLPSAQRQPTRVPNQVPPSTAARPTACQTDNGSPSTATANSTPKIGTQ